jgi:phosphonate transport system substrate-binding protein
MRNFKVKMLLPVFFLAGMFLSPQAESKEVVYFGVCPKYNARVMYQLYQPFVDYLNENTPYQFEIKLCRFYQETVDRLGKGETPIALCGAIPYIKAKEKYKVKPIIRALSEDGKAAYRGIIVVRHDSAIQNLSDLKGRSLAFAQEWSTAGYILPRYHLLRNGISLKDLKGYAFLRHHDFVADAVIKREFDAGAVKDVVAYKYQQKGIRHIFVTDPTPTVAVIASGGARKELINSVKTALLKLDSRNPTDQKRMSQWDEEINYGFMEASDSDYDPIRKILRVVERESKGKDQLPK